MSSSSQPKRSMFQLNESDLLCKNSCGYYGNPEWHGLCSKCFREYQKQAEAGRQKKPTKTKESLAEQSVSVRRSTSTANQMKDAVSPFDKFLSKKKQQSLRKSQTMKSIFTSAAAPAKDFETEHPQPLRQVSVEVQQVVKDFNEFLQTLPKPVAQDIARHVQTVANKLLKDSALDLPVDELSKIANNFYEEFAERLNRHEIHTVLTEELVTKIMDFSESYILVRSYKHLFCPSTTDDEDKDLLMQNRVRKLNWVTALRLGAMVEESSHEVRDAMDAAITDLIEVDTKRTVDAKLKCVVSCCRHIANMLQLSGNGYPSADHFLPAVIYVVLRANPPRMQSNIKFITRFANPNHLRTGEAGYFFTNLCCAVSFIEGMDARSLDMSEDEFQQYMTGDVGVTSATALYEQQAFMCDGLRQMSKNLQILEELRQRQARLAANIKKEQIIMEEFWVSCQQRLGDSIAKHALEVKPRREIPVFNFKGETDEMLANLPPPLIPTPSRSDISLATVHSLEMLSCLHSEQNLVESLVSLEINDNTQAQ